MDPQFFQKIQMASLPSSWSHTSQEEGTLNPVWQLLKNAPQRATPTIGRPLQYSPKGLYLPSSIKLENYLISTSSGDFVSPNARTTLPPIKSGCSSPEIPQNLPHSVENILEENTQPREAIKGSYRYASTQIKSDATQSITPPSSSATTRSAANAAKAEKKAEAVAPPVKTGRQRNANRRFADYSMELSDDEEGGDTLYQPLSKRGRSTRGKSISIDLGNDSSSSPYSHTSPTAATSGKTEKIERSERGDRSLTPSVATLTLAKRSAAFNRKSISNAPDLATSAAQNIAMGEALVPKFPVPYERGIHLRLGEHGRRMLKSLVQSKMHLDSDLRTWVRSKYGRVKSLTVVQLLAVANHANLWDAAVSLAQQFAATKGVDLLRAGTGYDNFDDAYYHPAYPTGSGEEMEEPEEKLELMDSTNTIDLYASATNAKEELDDASPTDASIKNPINSIRSAPYSPNTSIDNVNSV